MEITINDTGKETGEAALILAGSSPSTFKLHKPPIGLVGTVVSGVSFFDQRDHIIYATREFNPALKFQGSFAIASDFKNEVDPVLWISFEDSISEFKNLIDARLQYLNNLKNFIGEEGWIKPSRVSKSPTLESIDRTKDLLKIILNHVRLKRLNGIFSVPKLIMGPRIDGGISTEIHINKNIIFVDIKDSTFEISIEEDGTFFEVNEEDNSLDFLIRKYLDLYL